MFAVRYTWKSPASMENILPFWNMIVSYMTFEERELKDPTEAQKASDTPTNTAWDEEEETEVKVVISPILHTWYSNSCFTCDGSSTIYCRFSLAFFNIGTVF
jgi:hypothetical protein